MSMTAQEILDMLRAVCKILRRLSEGETVSAAECEADEASYTEAVRRCKVYSYITEADDGTLAITDTGLHELNTNKLIQKIEAGKDEDYRVVLAEDV